VEGRPMKLFALALGALLLAGCANNLPADASHPQAAPLVDPPRRPGKAPGAGGHARLDVVPHRAPGPGGRDQEGLRRCHPESSIRTPTRAPSGPRSTPPIPPAWC
jgi:hypothetical protein